MLKTEKEKKEKINEQVNKEIALVRKEKKKNKIDKPKKSYIKFKVGDSVRMFDGRSVGSIDLIEKNKATVNYGVFKTQVGLDLLEIVEGKQNKMKELIVFYDGPCVLCNSIILKLCKWDKNDNIRFTNLESDYAKTFLRIIQVLP